MPFLPSSIQKAWSNLINLGIRPEMGHNQKVGIQITNIICLLGVCHFIIDLFGFYRTVMIEDVYINVAFSFILVAFLSLHKLGKINTSRYLFQIAIPIVLGLCVAAFGISIYSVEVYFIVSIIIGLVSFHHKEHQIIIILWNILCFTLGTLYTYFFGEIYNIDVGVYERYAMAILSIIIVVFFFRFLINANKDFSSKISALTNRLANQNEKLSVVNKQLNEANADLLNYTYVASHDLKSPIRSIIRFQELILNEQEIKENPKLKEYLDIATNSAKQLNDTLTDLLQYSKLSNDNQNIKLEQVAIEDLVQQIIIENTNNEKWAEKAISVSGELPIVKGIKSQLKLVLQNLILNGIKYNRSEQPKVIVSGSRETHQTLIRIQDNGIGIAQKDAERIFEPFIRLHADQEFEGTGFGLAITKRIIDKLNAQILLESTIGEGSTFTLVFKN